MEKRSIEISKDVYEKIQRYAVPFEDTPDTVLRRLLNIIDRLPKNSPMSDKPQEVTSEESPLDTVDVDAQLEREEDSESPDYSARSVDDGGVTFPFTVCNSFLESVNHPVTIPKKFYPPLLASGLLPPIGGKREVTITQISGRAYPGYIYTGETRKHIYHQIRVIGRESTAYTSNLGLDDRVNITVRRMGSASTIIFARADAS